MTATDRRARPPAAPSREGGRLARVRDGLPFPFDPMGFAMGRFQRCGDVDFVRSADGSQPGLFVLPHPEHFEQAPVTEALLQRLVDAEDEDGSATIASRVRIEVWGRGVDPKARVALTPAGGLPLRVRRR